MTRREVDLAALARRLLADAATAAPTSDEGGPGLIARAAERAAASGPRHEVELARLLALGAYFDGRGDGARSVPDRLTAAARALDAAGR